jgi:excisionase family DNA binding protein
MVEKAISITSGGLAEDPDLHAVSRILRHSTAKLVGPKGENAVLPQSVYSLLKEIVRNLEDGHSLVVMSEEKQLTTQQAGEMLGMSRPYLIRLLDAGEMPYILVGKHRRVALRDVIAYGKRRAAARKSALDQIARDAFEAGLYDQPASIGDQDPH